jgi:hypothetical protein
MEEIFFIDRFLNGFYKGANINTDPIQVNPIVALDDSGGILGALALNRSGFCNVGVEYATG